MATKNGKMLKDFLQEGNTNNKAAVEAASSLPRSRSRSRAAAEAALTSFQKVLNAVRSFHSSTATPSTLQRSVSRRLLGRLYTKKNNRSDKLSGEVMSNKIVVVSVKVKDILRWKSFRVMEEEELETHHQPLDYFVGPVDDAPSTSDNSSSRSSNGSEMSWGENDSDFTVTAAEEVAEAAEEEEELPWCLGGSGDEGKKWDDDDDVIVASDSGVGPKEDKHNIASEEDTEQQSPVYVLDSPFRDEISEEEFPSSFDQKMANMERSKQRLLQSIQWFENLAGVHEDDETESIEEKEQQEEDNAIEAKRKSDLSRGFCWFTRGKEGLEDIKECIKNMEKQGQWSKFEEEKTELGVDLEVEMLSDLLDEIFIDFCG